MQIGKGTVGAPSRQFATPWLQYPANVQRRCVTQAGRDKGRDGRARGGSQGLGASSWLLPTGLVSERRSKDGSLVSDPDATLTVYTIRFTTGVSRGAALSDPNAAVNVCLIGQNGIGALHRVSPVNDPVQSRAHTLEMCQVIGPDVGADCTLTLSDEAASGDGSAGRGGQAQSQSQQQQPPAQGEGQLRGSSAASTSGRGSLVGRPPPPPPPKRRFQEGSVDEVSILVPELGPLSGVLVGVEGGTWYLDEMDVASSRTHHMERFVCRRTLGGSPGEGAALLTPVPAGAVVYGEGEAAVVLSKEQAAALWSLNMSDYDDLKRRVTITTMLLVASGASLAALTGGTAAALPYTAGGVVGLMYQWMLMRGVDHVVEAASGQNRPASRQGEGDGTGMAVGSSGTAIAGSGGAGGPGGGRVLASAPVRMGFVCASAALGLALLSQEEAATTVVSSSDLREGAAAAAAGSFNSAAAWQLALAALGFLTYKVALVGAALGDSEGSRAGLGLGLGGKVLQRQARGGGGNQTEFEKYKRD